MSFTTALSGLNAASNNLSVTGNNIANANTTGFKKSRSEFVDVYASSIGGVSKTQPGSGVRVSEVAQQFNQGNLDFTENSLDLAISGDGFFTLASNPTDLKSMIYSRSGAFRVNKDGLVTNTQGQALLAYSPNGKTVADGFSQGVLKTVSLNTGAGLPVSTTKVDLQVNLDSNSPEPPVGTFDPLDSNSYTKQSSVSVFDSLGVSHTLTTYFVAGPVTAGPTRDWQAFHYITDNPQLPVPLDPGGVNPQIGPPVVAGTPGTAGILTFDSSGKLVAPVDAKVDLIPYVTGTSAADVDVTMSYLGSTQLSAAFSVDALKQDGLPAGRLTGVSIDDEGVIFARFSNGGATPLGKVALTRFPNPQGLSKLGNTNWAQSANSGEPIPGEAGTGNFGVIQSGALEQSNVDLSAQLVNLIVAQQAYQANSQTISTENTIVQAILNIR
ncbi:MAG: flagellar hook protein FlgE [Methylococcaceae bacterium]|nr:flagellar hook protein FlgE [Methylococcaceae bacterium]